MREIKFRIYFRDDESFMTEPITLEDLLHEDWVEFENEEGTLSLPLKDFRFYYYKGSKAYEVMQYTGLKDKNGKEIYEGDIIRKLVWNEQKYMKTNNGECYSYAKIAYIEELAGFYIVNNEDKICWELGQDKYGIEVCGNIYDNPELLKEET